VGRVGMTDQCSFLIVGRGERARTRCVSRPQAQGEPWRTGGDWPSTRGGGGMATNHSRSAIFADGASAPPVTSFAASKALSRSIDATKAHDITLAGGAFLNGGIFLAVVAVDKAWKGSMAGERMNKRFGREVRGKRMS
jgi:hypothetical protein